mgnify:CR=1 FL=1
MTINAAFPQSQFSQEVLTPKRFSCQLQTLVCSKTSYPTSFKDYIQGIDLVTTASAEFTGHGTANLSANNLLPENMEDDHFPVPMDGFSVVCHKLLYSTSHNQQNNNNTSNNSPPATARTR